MSEEDEDKQVTVVKNATDLQRLKLEKLMKNHEKLAFIPDRPKEKKFSDPAEFVRNVMGSSAGAGSGEFHVYRHIRRREYSRQEFLQLCKEKEDLDKDYHNKLKKNRRIVEEKAAKNRAKRHRHKERQKAKRQKLKEMKKKGILPGKDSSSSSSEEEADEDETKVSPVNNKHDVGKTQESSNDSVNSEDVQNIDKERKGSDESTEQNHCDPVGGPASNRTVEENGS
ncbi:hypothetical protein OTU49_001055 [Cherax quadricarinatus]|uniref:PRKR-interacting protein 1 n=1 Tax=Cherax quadricarinatus TaxID=27406 RepID=A0AAW0YAE0_CHEQU